MRHRLDIYGYHKGFKVKKVFIVSDNKCGTSTLKHLFKQMGFNVANQGDAESLYFDELLEGGSMIRSRDWRQLIAQADVFQDVPFSTSRFLPWLLQHYPDSIYIHVSRASEDWYHSLINHHISRRLGEVPTFNTSGSLIWSEQLERKSAYKPYRGIPLHTIVARRYETPPSDPYHKESLINGHEFQQQQARSLLADFDSILLSMSDLSSGSACQPLWARFNNGNAIEIPHKNKSDSDD